MKSANRKTKIIATIGPACKTVPVLRKLVSSGADILRINTSHTAPAEIVRWFDLIHRLRRIMRRAIPILVDLQGPRAEIKDALSGLKPVKKCGSKSVNARAALL